MQDLFPDLSQAIEGSPLVAFSVSFLWGILSVVLSPCHLASIPLIIGFINGQGAGVTIRRAFVLSTVFAGGILFTIAVVGAITAAAGQIVGDLGRYPTYFVAAIFFIVGLHLIGVIPMPFSGPGQVNTKRRGVAAALILGLIFGIAVGPCTFAYIAPVIGVTFIAGEKLAYGTGLLVFYGVGHCSVIVLAGTCTELVQRYLNWTEKSKGAVILRGACGILVILGGLYLIYKA